MKQKQTYYQRHKEKRSAYGKLYYELHKEEIRKKHRQYYAKNKLKIRANQQERIKADRNKYKLRQHLYNKTYQQKHAEKIRAYKKFYHDQLRLEINTRKREWNATHRLKLKDWELQSSYGINLKQYLLLKRTQKHKCAICGKRTKLCVDHNHKTKLVRGLLCHQCNVMLGYARENSEILKAAIKYLRKYNV